MEWRCFPCPVRSHNYSKEGEGHLFLINTVKRTETLLELPANASFKRMKQAVGDLAGYDPRKVITSKAQTVSELTFIP